MDMIPALKVPKRYAQLFRKSLQHTGALDQRYSIQKCVDGSVTLPVLPSSLPQLDLNTLQRATACDGLCEIVQVKAQLSKKGNVKSSSEKLAETLRDLLSSHGVRWSEDLKRDIPQRWQSHGDLVLIGEDCFTLPAWKKMGSELWSAIAFALGAKRLAQMRRISKDGFRTPQVTMLLGDSSLVTHVDNKIRYEFDITKCMFSFGNITEKLRIASFNCRGETVVDLYAGIGYFTLPYLLHAGAAHVHACEWNPDAVDALRRNLLLNGVADRCTVHQGDNRQLALEDVADRVNLGLIPSSEEGWPVACRLLRRGTGGILHIHHNVTSTPAHCVKVKDKTQTSQATHTDITADSDGVDDETPVLQSTCKQTDREAWKAWAEHAASRIAGLLMDSAGGLWRTHIQHIEHVKSYAPHIHHIVLDLECRPL